MVMSTHTVLCRGNQQHDVHSSWEVKAQEGRMAVKRAGSEVQIYWLPALGSSGILPGKSTLNCCYIHKVFPNLIHQHSVWGISELGFCISLFVWDSLALVHNQGSWDSCFLRKHYFAQLLLYNSKQQVLFQKSLQPNGQNLSVAWQPICIILRFPAKLLKLIRWQIFIVLALINEKSRLLALATLVNRAVQ